MICREMPFELPQKFVHPVAVWQGGAGHNIRLPVTRLKPGAPALVAPRTSGGRQQPTTIRVAGAQRAEGG